MSLTCDEARAVFPIAWSLPPDRTVAFIREVDVALAGHPARGEGLAHRIAAELMLRYFIPPPMSKRMPYHHANTRRHQLTR